MIRFIQKIFDDCFRKNYPGLDTATSRSLLIQKGDDVDDLDCRKLLEDATYANTPEFTLHGKDCWAKCVKIYDGDTIHLAIILRNERVRIKCRLNGIDTAEIRSKDPIEKGFAIMTRDRLEELIGDGFVWTQFNDFDKYGRPLVTLYNFKKDISNGISINQRMLDDEMAYHYNGKTKIAFHEWIGQTQYRKKLKS